MANMLAYLVVFVVLLGRTTAEVELTLTRYKDAISLSTGPNRFSALARDHLWHKMWRSVEVSDNWTAYYRRTCVPTIALIDQMPADDREWFQRVYNRAHGDDVFLHEQNIIQPEIYVFKNGTLRTSLGRREDFILYEIDGYSVFMNDAYSGYLVTGDNFPEDFAYIWIEYDYVGIVKNCGEILLSPEYCHDSELMDYVKNLKDIIGVHTRADRKFLKIFNSDFGRLIHTFRNEFEFYVNRVNSAIQSRDLDLFSDVNELLAQQ